MQHLKQFILFLFIGAMAQTVSAQDADAKVYKFDGHYTYTVTSEGQQEELKQLFTNDSDQWGMHMSMQGAIATIVYENDSPIVLVEAGGQKMMMSNPAAMGMNPDDMQPTAEGEITKTDKSKTIMGYNCTGYEATIEGDSVIIWASDEIELKGGMFQNVNGIDGSILGVENLDSEKEVSFMLTSYEEDSPMTVDTTGYMKM